MNSCHSDFPYLVTAWVIRKSTKYDVMSLLEEQRIDWNSGLEILKYLELVPFHSIQMNGESVGSGQIFRYRFFLDNFLVSM